MIMAKRKPQRRKPLQPLKFNVSLALGTLNDNIVISSATIDSIEQDFDIVTTHCFWTLRDHTAGEGPIVVGISEQGYSVAEIAECNDASPLSQYGPAYERSRRKIRTAGVFRGQVADETINDGEVVKTKLFLRGFAHSTFAVARLWAQNRSGANLTTGAVVDVQGVHWGRWK